MKYIYKEPGEKSSPDLVKSLHQFGDRSYGRVPMQVNSDKRLSGSDVRVLCGIAYYVHQGNTCRESYSTLAVASGVSRRQVVTSVARLRKFGWIEQPDQDERKRQWLMLTSPVFGQKQRAGVEETVSVGPASLPRRRLATVAHSA
jgi:hypothetical protein